MGFAELAKKTMTKHCVKVPGDESVYLSTPKHIWSFFKLSLREHALFCTTVISTLSSSKLGLAAGSSALSPPEMLFRTWGGGQGGHCTQRTRPRGVGADCQTVSTSQPDLSRLKTLTPARARRLGAEKTSPKKIWVLDFKQGGREIGISHLPRARPSYFLLRPWLSRD